VIAGDHSSVHDKLTANSTLINRVTQLVQESTSRSEAVQHARIEVIKTANRLREQANVSIGAGPVQISDWSKNSVEVLIISCSATKSDAQGFQHPRSGWVVDRVRDPTISAAALEQRARILSRVQTGMLEGIEFKEGNRTHMPANQSLFYGPDFGGFINENRYLPAYMRYTGRCYRALREEWEAMLHRDESPSVLIMSGLYGLIPATEAIQNYDVHITDVDSNAGVTVQAYWKSRDLMTQILISHLEWLESQGKRIRVIIDALSELSYQETINWGLVDSRWPTVHRVFEKSAGRDALGNLGLWMREVVRNRRVFDSLKPDTFYAGFGFANDDRIAFESRIGSTSLSVARETE